MCLPHIIFFPPHLISSWYEWKNTLPLKCGFKWYLVNPTADALALHCLKECCKHWYYAWEFACFMRIVRCIRSSLMHEKIISTRCWVQKCNVDTNIVYCLVNRCTKTWRQSKQTSARLGALQRNTRMNTRNIPHEKPARVWEERIKITVSHGIPSFFAKEKL